MLDSWHSYGIQTKFLNISTNKSISIPIVISENNPQLKKKISDYENLTRPDKSVCDISDTDNDPNELTSSIESNK